MAMLTVCSHGLGKKVNISSSLDEHSQLWANLCRRSKLELSFLFFFLQNKQEAIRKLSHQSLNIASSSSALVKTLCHTFRYAAAGSYVGSR